MSGPYSRPYETGTSWSLGAFHSAAISSFFSRNKSASAPKVILAPSKTTRQDVKEGMIQMMPGSESAFSER
jgi:hypothetical protein